MACEQKGASAGFTNTTEMVNEIQELVESHLTKRNNAIYHEIKHISDRIIETKEALKVPSSEDAVNEAKGELCEVIKSTEEATDTILDMAEHIQACCTQVTEKNIAQDIQNDVSRIFEACNFQDLTGQRITKVNQTLDFVENSVGSLLKALVKSLGTSTQQTEEDKLKNGPQQAQKAPSQDDIDRLFECS